MIDLSDVRFRYTDEQEQLRGVSLHVAQGELVVLTGPSGCGKTTLTRVVNGLVPGFYGGELEGEVRIDGQDTATLESWQYGTLVGSVFQDPKTQFFAPIVRDEIAFGCENYGIASTDIRARVDELSHALQIRPLLDRELFTLSSGEKQKVAVAAAAGTRPAIYVIDEPSANLDMRAAQDLAHVLGKLKQAGNTILIAEHRLHWLMEIADRIVYMNDGQIVETFTPAQLQILPSTRLRELGIREPSLPTVRTVSPPSRSLTPDATAVIQVDDLNIRHRRRGDPLLTGLSFAVSPGEVVALTGANGTGKTTLARTLCGLHRLSSGSIRFDGAVVRTSRRRERAWFVMQDADNQLFADSVIDEMTHGRRKTTETDLASAEQILAKLGLWQYRDRHPGSLSGGQKQRLTIAVALMQDRPLLILDEPTSGLDGRNLARVADLIKQQASRGKALLLITHDHELALRACTRMIVLSNGEQRADFPINSESVNLAVAHLMRGDDSHGHLSERKQVPRK
ncbi:MAG: ABC transporter ATP-binding protein [Microbacteriaceae bacterium]